MNIYFSFPTQKCTRGLCAKLTRSAVPYGNACQAPWGLYTKPFTSLVSFWYFFFFLAGSETTRLARGKWLQSRWEKQQTVSDKRHQHPVTLNAQTQLTMTTKHAKQTEKSHPKTIFPKRKIRKKRAATTMGQP